MDGGRRGCVLGGGGKSTMEISGVMVTLRARELPTGEAVRANGKGSLGGILWR